MNTSPRIVASHIFLAREGASFSLPAPGTVGRESKPGPTDSVWFKVGVVEDLEVTPTTDQKEVMAPAPGRRVRYDVRESGVKVDLKWTCQELSPLVYELLFRSSPLGPSSTQFNPGTSGPKRFWLQVQQYDDTDAFVCAAELFGVLTVNGTSFGEEIVRAQMEFKMIQSTLNTGTLG